MTHGSMAQQKRAIALAKPYADDEMKVVAKGEKRDDAI